MSSEELIADEIAKGTGSEEWLSADTTALLLIVQAWAAVLVLINPLGDFPVVDDWAYLASVKSLAERGQIVFSDWTAANLLSQIVWGTLFAVPFGTTYTVLRFSTLVLALAGAAALYRTLRESGCAPGIALLGALVFLLNPIICVLSASFMSDVPYAAMQTIAMWLLLAGLRSGSKRQLGLGWILAVVALLCRQVGMAIPLGYAAAKIAQKGLRTRILLLAVAPFAAFVAFQFLYQAGLEYWRLVPADFGRQIGFMTSNVFASPPLRLAGDLFHFATECFYYLGIFLLPLSLLVTAQVARTLLKAAAIGLWTGLLLLSLLLAWLGPSMPVWSNNTILPWSLGTDIIGVPPPSAFWPIVTVFSAFGGLMLLVALAVAGRAAWRDFRQESALPAIFAAVAALALLGSMAMLPPETQFDRYIIPVIPCLVVVLCTRLRMAAMSAIPRWATLTSATSLCAIAIYSVLGTHDYFSEKRVRWTALQDLVKNDRVPPENVDAGWVYNAPTSFGVYGDPNDVDTWFKTQEYLVYSSLTPGLESVQGYTVVRSYPVQRWAPWNTAQSAILVMHRLAGPPG